MSDLSEVRRQVLTPLCKRGAGGICFPIVSAGNLKSPSLPLLQRGMNAGGVRRNNQLALRRMFGCLHLMQCSSPFDFAQNRLIAVYRISQKPSHQLRRSHYVELRKLDDEPERAA